MRLVDRKLRKYLFSPLVSNALLVTDVLCSRVVVLLWCFHRGYPCPKFKLIILDEADTMTPEAQSALRRIIENYSKVTRFCLICNYVTRVIEPLASRCAKFRFKSLPPISMKTRIQDIASKEGVSVTEDTLNTLLSASQGDMRKAVTFLQSCHQLAGTKGVITPDIVYDVSGRVSYISHIQLLYFSSLFC